MKNLSIFPVRFFFTTSCLIIALATSSFAMGPKRVETSVNKREPNRNAASPERQITSSDNTDERGGKPGAVDETIVPSSTGASATAKKKTNKTNKKAVTPAKENLVVASTAASEQRADTFEISGPIPTAAAAAAAAAAAVVNRVSEDTTAVEKKVLPKVANEKLLAELKDTLAKKKQKTASSAEAVITQQPPSVAAATASTDVDFKEEEKRAGALNPKEVSGGASADYVEAASAVEKVGPQKEDGRRYLTREEFVAFLGDEVNKWMALLSNAGASEAKGALNDPKAIILAQAQYAAERLHLKYSSEIPSSGSSQEDQSTILPSVRLTQETSATSSDESSDELIRKQMTPLQFDQEIHEAIQQKTEEALQLLDETQSAENQAQLRACLNAVTYLSSYSELYFNQESLGNLAVPILTNYEKLIVQSLRQTEITPVDKQKGEEAFERQVIWDFNSSFQENMRKFALVDSAYFPANNKFFYDDQRVGELTFTKDGSALEFRHQRTVSRVISSAPKERVEGETVARKILPNLQQNSGSGGFTTPPRGRPSLNIDTNLDDARTPAFTRCRVLSGISVAALVAAIAYEYYLHSLQLSSQAASGQATSPWGSLFMNQSSPTTFLGLAR